MNVTAAIHMHARLRPRAPAVISPTRSLNFAQLDAAIWRAAARFRAEGLEAGQVVVVDIGDSIKHLIVALALARAGIAHLANIHGHDAAVVAPLMARLNAVRTISDAEMQDDKILFGRSVAGKPAPTEPATAVPDIAGVGAGLPANASESIQIIAADMMKHESTPWLYVASSGTTGRPKIVAITHRMTLVTSQRHAAGVPVLMSNRYLPFSDLAFYSAKRQTVSTLNVGGCVVLAGGLDIERMVEFIRRARVTRISCAVVHLHRLCTFAREAREDMLLPELQAIEATGSTVTEELRRRVRQKVNRSLYVNYGTTETSIVAVAPPQTEIPDTVGAALPGVRLQIVDDADKPLPRGEVGIIRIRASGAADGYFDDAEATAKVFRRGWFYTGDLGVMTEDEQLIFKGRADDMMIVDGINVFPAEIEAVLAGHEAVGEAAAFPMKSEIHQDVPVAAVKLRAPATDAELLSYCRARLGSRAPQRIVVVGEFPRNPAGKILKRELLGLLKRKLAAAAAETPGAHAAERGKQNGVAREEPSA